MQFVVIGKDKGSGEHRARHRGDHLEYIAGRQGSIIYAGPLLESDRMVGSLFVFDMADRAELDAYLGEDPYFTGGVFETVEIFESRRMIPERSPGFLLEEAQRARASSSF